MMRPQAALRSPVSPRRMVQRAQAKVQSLPAPVGGWNARDSFANMDPLDAISLVNMFPSVSNVALRGGYTKWSTGLDGQVQTLMAYNGGATEKLFAITSTGKIYDVSTAGAVGAAVVSGLSNGIWEYANISVGGTTYLYAVNGVDKPQLYNGATWTAIDGASTPAITGVTTTTLSNILLFKHRIWFIQKNTLKAWYLPTDSIGGAAQSFDLSQVATRGGYLVDMGAWTLDAGYGADDNLVFITSTGEVIVYRGTDPASSGTWAGMGVWQLGAPVGSRPMLKWGGDLLVLTFDGLLPMAAALQSSRLDPRVALSDKIQGAITQATSDYESVNGWQVYYNAKFNAVMVNVPVAIGQQQQYVMNTITKAWCNFTGWAANCFETFQDNPYFGGNGYVALAWASTYEDDGANIPGTALQAFNYYGSRGVKKYFTRARPSVFSNGSPAVSVGMNIDFDTSDTTAPISYGAVTAGVWGTGVWGVFTWGSSSTINNTWLGITGIGYCGAIQMKTASSGLTVEWASTDIVYQTGWAGV